MDAETLIKRIDMVIKNPRPELMGELLFDCREFLRSAPAVPAGQCHVCGDPTLMACSDCRINFAATVYVCTKSSCRDEHELKCFGDKAVPGEPAPSNWIQSDHDGGPRETIRERRPSDDEPAPLDRYRYAVQYAAADAWDGGIDIRRRFEWAAANDPGSKLTDNEAAKIGQSYLVQEPSVSRSEPVPAVTGLPEGHGEPCYYCGEKCSALAGDPGRWPLAFGHLDNPGVTKWHHTSCVTNRLIENQPAPAVMEHLERRIRGYKVRGDTIYNGKIIAEELLAVLAILQAKAVTPIPCPKCNNTGEIRGWDAKGKLYGVWTCDCPASKELRAVGGNL